MTYSNAEIRKDAKRYAKAKMDYGDGAGIRRRHINAELEKKLQNESYRQAFEAELGRINMDQIIDGINAKHAVKGVQVNGKKVFKNLMRAGALAGTAYAFYSSNKEGIDRFANGVKVSIKNKINKRKYKEQIRPATMTDKEKAEAYLRSVGIKVVK